MDRISILGLSADTIIGDLPWEREQRQLIRAEVHLETDLRPAGHSDNLADTIDYAAVGRSAVAYIQQTQFRMLEALAEGLAVHLLECYHPIRIALTLRKPAHFPGATEVAVTITRP